MAEVTEQLKLRSESDSLPKQGVGFSTSLPLSFMPHPQASPIRLSDKQLSLLEQIARCSTNPYQLVRRVQLILATAKGLNNTELAEQLQWSRNSVRLWRERWQASAPSLSVAEAEGVSELHLKQCITEVLSDEPRSGTPVRFSLEQVVEIVALACETPSASERPVSHWTPAELAAEAVKRGIVERISVRSVGRFLKGSHSTTTPQPLLAQRQSR